MKRILNLVVLGCLIALPAGPAYASKVWETDFEKAKETAKKTNRYMLLDFSGSDWCGWCIKLNKEVFDKKAFTDYAEENLVCVLLDFPRRTKIKKSLAEQNQKLKQEYGVRGFPTVLVLCPEGSLVQKTGYRKGGAAEYVAHLKAMIDPHRKKNKVPEPTDAKALTGAGKAFVDAFSDKPLKYLPRDENREVRTWRSASGTEIKASVLQELGARVVLKKEDGTTVQILRSQLSEEDRKYIAELKAGPEKKAE